MSLTYGMTVSFLPVATEKKVMSFCVYFFFSAFKGSGRCRFKPHFSSADSVNSCILLCKAFYRSAPLMTQSLCYTGRGTSVFFTDMISILKLSAWLLSEIMSEFCLAYYSSEFAWNSDKFFFILPGIVTLLTVGDGDRILFIFSYKQSCFIYSAILTSRELMHKVLFEKFRGSICDKIDSLSLSHILPSPMRLLFKSPLFEISVKFCSFSTILVMLSRV